MQGILGAGDFLSLMLQTLMQTVRDSTQRKASFKYDSWDIIGGHLISHCPKAFHHAIQRDYLHVLDCLRAMDESHASEQIKFWNGFSERVEITEAGMRAAQAQEMLDDSGRVAGCGWYRCVMYGEEPTREMFLCAGCSSVRYCGVLCQDRWERCQLSFLQLLKYCV